jgi:UPF0755 protein
MHRLIGLVVIVVSMLGGWLWMDYEATVNARLELSQTVYFEIAKGEGISRIANSLEAQHILAKPLWFTVLAYVEGKAKRLKYGEYEIRPEMTLRELLNLFATGKIRQHPVSIIEGWTFRQTLNALERHPALVSLTTSRSVEEIMRLIGAAGLHPEGRFFPSTYFVTKGTSNLEVLKRARQKMQEVLDREWAEREPKIPLATPDEALVLASIIEKETALSEERPLVAGVFLRRMIKGMLLQTDPTVIYGLGEQYTGDLRRGDLLMDTPYNTYTREGLPPTPIAMPSLSSIHAALHPAQGDSLYFVSRGDGTHTFSATLEQHHEAVSKYQKH